MEIQCYFQLFKILAVTWLIFSPLSSEFMAAVKDVWLVGDRFVKINFHEVETMVREAKQAKHDAPYLNRYYNIKPQFSSSLSKNIFSRLADMIVEAVNMCQRLPRFIIILLNKDLLTAVCNVQHGFIDLTQMDSDIAQVLDWVITLFSRHINTLKTDMYYKKPGSATAAEPKFVWVKMLPQNVKDKVEFFRYRFNQLLEDKITAKKHHYILDAAAIVHDGTYDKKGDLTTSGVYDLWHEISQQLDLFDKFKLELKPITLSQKV